MVSEACASSSATSLRRRYSAMPGVPTTPTPGRQGRQWQQAGQPAGSGQQVRGVDAQHEAQDPQPDQSADDARTDTDEGRRQCHPELGQ